MKELRHEQQSRAFDTDKVAEKRSLKVVDALWKKVWNKWLSKPQETYQSLKHGETKIERDPNEGGDIVG